METRETVGAVRSNAGQVFLKMQQKPYYQRAPSWGMDSRITGPVIGVDEAGRGPVMGPLVIAAVFTTDQEELRGMGVRDSKQLSPGRREELSRAIRRSCRVETAIITAQEIDNLRKRITLNQIEVNAFSLVIRTFLTQGREGGDPTIILDAVDVKEERFGRDVEATLLTKLGSVPRIISRHKADDIFPVVSAASIIAKVIRDDEIESLRKRYGVIGSGYPSDPATRKYLLNLFNTEQPIPPFVRQSWETLKRISEEASRTSLDDFL